MFFLTMPRYITSCSHKSLTMGELELLEIRKEQRENDRIYYAEEHKKALEQKEEARKKWKQRMDNFYIILNSGGDIFADNLREELKEHVRKEMAEATHVFRYKQREY